MGSVRKKGKGYEIRFYNQEGKQQAKTIKGTKRDAEAVLAETEKSISLGTYCKPAAVTVRRLLEDWLKERSGRVEPTTLYHYGVKVNSRLIPVLGNKLVQSLTPRDIEAVVNAWKDEGLAPNTIRGLHSVLRAALRYAVRMELIGRDPASNVMPPSSVSVRHSEVLTDDQIDQLLSASKTQPCRAPVSLAVLAGLRIGEVCGLRWEDVDLERRELSVRSSVGRVEGRLVLKGPKSRSSRRPVSLPGECVEDLSLLPRECPLVFHRDGELFDPGTMSRQIRRLMKAIGVDTTTHGLRHSHASQLMRLGIHPRVVQDRLGHATMDETMATYTHVISSQQGEVAKVLDARSTRSSL